MPSTATRCAIGVTPFCPAAVEGTCLVSEPGAPDFSPLLPQEASVSADRNKTVLRITLFGYPGFVIAGRRWPQLARAKRSIGAESLHRAGEIGRRLLLELAHGRQRLLRQFSDRPS